jgi:hypothetical protein
MSINDHSECSLSLQLSRPMPLFIFYTLFAYELWIENWNCDFPLPLPIYHCSFFFTSPPCCWEHFFCMFGRYRDLIVLSTLKDSYDLISIMIKARQKTYVVEASTHFNCRT